MKLPEHPDENLNERARYLILVRRIWYLAAGAAAGALIGLGLYFFWTTAFAPTREYTRVSKLYIDFARDEYGVAYDYYNGGTWTDLLTAEPRIADRIEEKLPAGTDLTTVKNEVKAEILTNIHLMTVTVTDPDADRSEAIGQAVDAALVAFGEEAKEFTEIRLLNGTPPTLVSWSNRTKNAVLLGLLLGLVAGFFTLLVSVTLDDAVRVPEDAAARYGLPVIAVEGENLPDFLKAEADEALAGLSGSVRVTAKEPVGTILRKTGAADCGEKPAILLEIPFGKADGTRTEHFLAVLEQSGITPAGIVITGADGRFLKRYYRVR